MVDKDLAETKQHLATLTTQIGKAEALSQNTYQDSEGDRKVINYIFHKLQAICPAWQQSLAGMAQDEKERLLKTQKREWLDSLMMAGINQRHIIDYALNQVKASGNPFMPTIGQFLGWCAEGNIPEGTKSPHEAYKEICQYDCLPREKKQPWGLSPEVYHTLNQIGRNIFEWQRMNKEKHKKYWEDEYQKTLERLRQGKPLVEAKKPEAFLENKRTPLDKSKAMSELQKMKESLK